MFFSYTETQGRTQLADNMVLASLLLSEEWLEEDNIHTEMVDDGSMTEETVTTTPTDGGAWSMAAI